MLKKYTVTLIETNIYSVTVEAENEYKASIEAMSSSDRELISEDLDIEGIVEDE